jgi:hypothetical protein
MLKKPKLIVSVGALLLLTLSTLSGEYVVNIKIPKVPEVPKVEAKVPVVNTIYPDSKSNEEILKEVMQEEKWVFSDHVAPVIQEESLPTEEVIEAGDIDNGRVAAYLHYKLLSLDEVKSRLQKAGFEIVTTLKIEKKGKVLSVVFTNKELQESAAKTNRGFASTLRLSIDTKAGVISISNPIYILAAFMQKEYDSTLAQKSLKQIRSAFEGLKNSDEIVKFRVLERFKFMEGMPQYQDMAVIKKAKNSTLLAKAHKSKKIVYEQTLSNGSTILGVKLGKRTRKFVKKIGYHNSGLLPYPVLIENGEAKILDPKYYIAVMYPMLKMSQFMTISTVPGAITKDIDKIFR